MIDVILSGLVEQVNTYLKQQFNLNEDIVVLSPIILSDGSVPQGTANKVVVMLTNISVDESQKNVYHPTRNPNTNPLPFLEYSFIAAAHFEAVNYAIGLKSIFAIAEYFSSSAGHDSQEVAKRDSRMLELNVKMLHQTDDQLATLWSRIGAKYMPSLLYKIQVILAPAPGRSERPVLERKQPE